MNVSVKNLDVYYEIHGGGDNNLLFLHGWGAPVSTYKAIFEHLAGRGYRVIAPDMPGCGKTPLPSAPLTVDDYKGFIFEFCQNIELSTADIMCHSHGGRVATAILSDRTSPLLCTRAVYMDASGVMPKRSAGYRIKLFGYKIMRFLGTFPLTKPFFWELYEVMRDRRSSADYRAAAEVMKKTMSNVVNTDMTPYMPQIEAEILLIFGEKDTATPPTDGSEMERLIKKSGLALIKNAGHYPFVDNPQQFYAVLDAFL